ncbi:7-cyano-7-deazaguanine synthase QueC [Pseudenhygromyxa sp. WMMC2535]|uniref:7-cyano-7-deazaguanine synthase QueC n=1 Tax=Pseudenhygromyxa sp. WMMC2535 TaxID=2712867 RepID=UPI00155630F2|nr:7-cyano-7-deazaguanine synthase QueC [Pseudenhygromyxa sp. WMMC2535]NVB37995.1 7-cyano-7-deazaguanine synthase QueC [Pseudenhygromyxa sp. WMMC2535]
MSDSPRPDTPAVVLLSGGLDSTTVLAIAAREAGQRVHALSFAYGQRHALELACARRQAERFGAVAHEVIDIAHLGALTAPASSLLAASALNVPAAAEREQDPDADPIPSTYVPARNTLFLSYALAWAEVVGARDIWIGVNAVDYSGYPDCRPEFVSAFEAVANLGTKLGVTGEGGAASATSRIRVRAPLIQLYKRQIVSRGIALGVDYADTLSCYDPRTGTDPSSGELRPLACGRCESCALRRQGFLDAGFTDPTVYAG